MLGVVNVSDGPAAAALNPIQTPPLAPASLLVVMTAPLLVIGIFSASENTIGDVGASSAKASDDSVNAPEAAFWPVTVRRTTWLVVAPKVTAPKFASR